MKQFALRCVYFGLILSATKPAAFAQISLAPAEPYVMQEVAIPMPEAGEAGLMSLLILPRTPGRHPLVMMTHETLAIHMEARRVGPGAMLPEARWFVLRGWAVAIVGRRGYGKSGGTLTEDTSECRTGSYDAPQAENAKDLEAAYVYLGTLPAIDTSRTIAVGYREGGTAAMWFAGEGHPGLKAVISFSGGRMHVPAFVESCTQLAVLPAYRGLAKRTNTPMLWLHRKSGDYNGTYETKAGFDTYVSAGGNAELALLSKSPPLSYPLFGGDAKEWGPIVERFLQGLNLPATAVLAYEPPKIVHDARIEGGHEEYLQHYLQQGPNKAFAAAPNGRIGAATGMATLKLAKETAIDRCGHMLCKIVLAEGQ